MRADYLRKANNAPTSQPGGSCWSPESLELEAPIPRRTPAPGETLSHQIDFILDEDAASKPGWEVEYLKYAH
jgi:hypothetical protein